MSSRYTKSPSLRAVLILLQNLEQSEIEKIVATIESEKEAEAEKKKQRMAATQAGQAAMAMGNLSGDATPGEGTATPGEAGANGATTSGPGAESGVQ